MIRKGESSVIHRFQRLWFQDYALRHRTSERRCGAIHAKLLRNMLAVHRDRIEIAVELFGDLSRRESLPQ